MVAGLLGDGRPLLVVWADRRRMEVFREEGHRQGVWVWVVRRLMARGLVGHQCVLE